MSSVIRPSTGDECASSPTKIVMRNTPPFGDVPLMLGIDEAGRGPVLGPMVYAVAFVAVSQAEWLKELHVADSKVLTEAKRDEIYYGSFLQPENRALFGWEAISLSPAEISAKMLQRQKHNLNLLSHDTAIALISHVVAAGYRIESVFVDTVGDPAKYAAKIRTAFPAIASVVVTTKADSKFPIVSAASIVAKVTRDAQLKHWQFAERDVHDVNFGSGYPADPNTVKWLSRNFHPVFGFPSVIRFSWSTCEKIIQEKGEIVKWKYDDEDDAKDDYAKRVAKTPSSSANVFFSPAKATRQTFLSKNRLHASFLCKA